MSSSIVNPSAAGWRIFGETGESPLRGDSGFIESTFALKVAVFGGLGGTLGATKESLEDAPCAARRSRARKGGGGASAKLTADGDSGALVMPLFPLMFASG